MIEQQQLIGFIQQYGYWILYPLMVIEGPVITLVGGGLSALGVLRIEIVFLLSVIGDLTMDIGLYYIGLYGNKRLRRWIAKHKKLELKRKQVRKFFKNHGGKIIFFVKISSGLCYITFITAGMIRMPLKRFLFFSLIGGILWSGVLVTLGYFYGHLYQEISGKIEQAGLIIITLAVLSFVVITLFKKFGANTLIKSKNL
jgi:membrane protein DedA with SNARE-associated domain